MKNLLRYSLLWVLLLGVWGCKKEESNNTLPPIEQSNSYLTSATWQLVGMYNNNREVTDIYPMAVAPKMEWQFKKDYTFFPNVYTSLFGMGTTWRLTDDKTMVLEKPSTNAIIMNITTLNTTELKMTFGYLFQGDTDIETYELRFKKK